MSYSFREPEFPAVCECKYDEAHDEMDREDCPFHCELTNNHKEDKTRRLERIKPGATRKLGSSAA